MATVQKIRTGAYTRQGIIEFDGPPEDLGKWLEAGGGVATKVVDGLLGWGEYKQVVRLLDVDGSCLYYLVPQTNDCGRR